MAWLTNWNRRKQLYISSTNSTTQSSYQIVTTIHYGSGTDSTGNIYCGNNVKSDFSDIRFTDSTGSTLLNYWIEYITGTSPNQSANIWINIPSIPTGSNSAYIYIYYNNPSATTTSNGQTTFLAFSDISNLASWTGGGASYQPVTNVNGEIFITESNKDVNTKPVNISGNWIFEMRYREHYGSEPEFSMYIGNGSGATIGSRGNIYAYRPKLGTYSASPILYDAGGTLYSTFAQDTYYILKEVRKGTNLYDHFLLDSNRNQLGSLLNTSSGSGSSADPITAIQFTPKNHNNLELHIVWLLIRKYSSPEPTWSSSINSEELTGPNITATAITSNPSQTPCGLGTCNVIIAATWQNIGNVTGTFTPSLKIDGNVITSPYSPRSLDPGVSTTLITFDVTILLTMANHTYTICPDPS